MDTLDREQVFSDGWVEGYEEGRQHGFRTLLCGVLCGAMGAGFWFWIF